ncbi:MAG TPA: carbohydrate-binding family 9-like protein, partial [Candidatus Binatia bacterium]|nr:carbohydrate-binding family 9-like protein [Candidatus Binatia bacterium]
MKTRSTEANQFLRRVKCPGGQNHLLPRRFSPAGITLFVVLVGCLALTPVLSRAGNLAGWQDRMQIITPKSYLCRHVSTPVEIDGKLDDAGWSNAPWTDAFVDIQGDAKSKPRFRTRARMLWDDHYLYLAAELEEPDVWATLTNHDSVIFQDPDFEVFINPNGETQPYYEFEMNALNTTWDLRLNKPYMDQGKPDNAWEIPGAKTAVHVNGTLNHPGDTDQGWTVEMAFPWEALSQDARHAGPPADGEQWRINFSRVEWRITTTNGVCQKVPGVPEDNWVWSPQGVVDMHRPEMWGVVQFSTAPVTKMIPIAN